MDRRHYPTLIFHHGSWHDPSCFNKIISPLSSLGYKCICLERPSIGPLHETKTSDDDVSVIRAAVQDRLDEGEEVIMIAHSSAGVVVTSALEGLGRSERQKAALPGGVVCLAMICALLGPQGGHFDAVARMDWSWNLVEGNTVTPENPKYHFYNDLSPEEADGWVAKLRPAHFPNGVTTYEGWRDVPIHYLICEQDKAVPVTLQEAMVAAVRERGATVTTERIASSHSPFLSQPDRVVEWIHRVAGEFTT